MRILKLKILAINCVYKSGSTGKIIQDISAILEPRGCEFVFCYEYGELIKKKNVYRLAGRYEFLFYYIWSRMIGLQYGTGYISTIRLIKIIKKESPDIVHIHCPNIHTVNIYKLLNYLKQKQIKTVITNHAEFFYTGNCPHSYECESFKTGCGNCDRVSDASRSFWFDRTAYAWKQMKDAFNDFKNIVMVSVSGWVDERLHQSPICTHLKSYIINNGIDTVNVFKSKEFYDIKEKLSITNEKILLHVTVSFTNSENDLKGGRYIIDLASRLVNYNIKIIVVGPNYLNQDIILPPNIITVGKITNQEELAKYYSIADLTVITSRRETYGMVCAESLACGTPVIGFKSGGPETISLKEYSEFVNYGNVNLLKECVEKWIDKKELIKKDIANIAAEHYSKEKMADQYYKVYKELQSK